MTAPVPGADGSRRSAAHRLRAWLRRRTAAAGVALGTLAVVGAVALFAQSAGFTVNDNRDDADATPGDGVCATANGTCTLRAAIQEANAAGGSRTIAFALPGCSASTATAGTGFRAEYFNNTTLTGTPALVRNEVPAFDWGTGSPGTGVNADRISARWRGQIVVPATASYTFRTNSDDGIRLWINGQLVIDNWTDHAASYDTSAAVSLTAGQRATVVMEWYENTGIAVAALEWRTSFLSPYVSVPLSVAAGGACTIQPTSALPAVTAAVAIDATTQPGWAAGAPIVELVGDRAGAGASGLVLSGAGASVRGLVVNRFAQDGVVLNAAGQTSQGNWLGVDASGNGPAANARHGLLANAGNGHAIGGTTVAQRNVLSANGGAGLYIGGGGGHTIQGNHVGVGANGSTALGNTGFYGIEAYGTGSNTIGGTTAGAGNVVSGQSGASKGGIWLSSSGNTVQGNRIGTDATGTASVPNASHGIAVWGGSGNTIGGSTAGAGNLIAANGGAGVMVRNGASGVIVRGNTIGLDANGAARGNAGGGVATLDALPVGLTLGGTGAGDRNVVSGNGSHGIALAATGGTVQVLGNAIGVGTDGTTARGNAGDGVRITGAATVTVGGLAAGQGNTIAHNTGDGVATLITGPVPIRGNAMWSNGGQGIDLGGDGDTANDDDNPVSAPNRGMDTPVIASAVFTGDQLDVVGRVGNTPGLTRFAGALVDVYRSTTGTTGARGQGRTWLGTLTADASGLLNGRLTLPGGVTLAAGDLLTATATDAAGNTSEFGPNLATTAATAFQNGSFETVAIGSSLPPLTNGVTLTHGDTRIVGWTVLHVGADWVGGSYWPAAQGSYSIDGNGGGTGAIQQSFTTVPGVRYQLRWSTALNTNFSTTSASYTVTASGGGTTTFSDTVAAPNTAQSGTYASRSMSFVAGSPLTTLTFRSTSPGSAGAVWDGLSLQAVAAIGGTVFEDPNYGGGAGRPRTATGATGVGGARVELYNALGTLQQTTTTDATGAYRFEVPPNATYTVRVVGGTVRSTRPGWTSGLLPVQTYRTNAITGTAVAVTDRVGGENPALADAGNGATTLLALTTLATTAQSITTVTAGSADIADIDFGFNFSTVVNTNDSGQGSLRQWILNANALGGEAQLAQTGRTAGIESSIFVLPTTAAGYQALTQHWRISPSTALPTITASLVALDGLTQPGAAAGDLWSGTPHTIKVELSGANAGVAVTGSDVTVRGVAIGGTSSYGVSATGAARFALRTSLVGTDITGSSAANTGGYCVYLQDTVDAEVGGSGAGDGNVIAGSCATTGGIAVATNRGTGFAMRGNFVGSNMAGTALVGTRSRGWNNIAGTVTIREFRRNLFAGHSGAAIAFETDDLVNPVAGQSSWTIAGNHIGVGRDGTTALANGRGIGPVDDTQTSLVTGLVIGGTAAADRNVIAGNSSHGVVLRSPSAPVRIVGNLVGVAADGSTARGNGGDGVRLETAQAVTVGGLAAGEANTIANNAGRGVNLVTASAPVTLRGNAMWANAQPGIDLGNDGATANDGAKPTTAPNQGMDTPVLGSAVFAGDQLDVVGRVGSSPGQTLFAGATVDLYRSTSGTAGSAGQGRTWIATVTADANGLIGSRITVPAAVTLANGDLLTATATDAAGNTSEFAPNVAVVAASTAIVNGDFETGPAVAGNAVANLSHGDAQLTGWTVLWTSVDYHGPSVLSPSAPGATGGRHVDLTGSTAGGLQQSLATTPGTTYVVAFQHAANTGCGVAGARPFTVSAAGASAAFAPTATAVASGPLTWQRGTLRFTATSALTALRFTSGYTAGTCGPVIDAVRFGVARSIAGTVFEDVNYGGGAGRARASATGAAPMPSASVELIDSSGALVTTTTTASDGSWRFDDVPADHYLVRVPTAALRSTRPNGASAGAPVQTFRQEAGFAVQAAVTDEVGGADPTVADTAAGAGSYAWTGCAFENATCSFTGTRVVRYGAGTTWTTRVLTGGTACTNAVFGDPLVGTVKACQTLAVQPHSLSSVSTVSGDRTGIDFGYHFHTVVNTNDSGPGSLRQAITNAVTLGGEASLAQVGQPSGTEAVVFTVADGVARPGLRAGLNLFGGATAAAITPASALPAVTGAVRIDARTQPGWSGTPRIELRGPSAGASANGLQLTGNGGVVQGLAISGFAGCAVRLDGTGGHTVAGNFLGTTAAGTAAATGNGAIGVCVNSPGNTVGGTGANDRNVIGGFVAVGSTTGRGIDIAAGANGNTVAGNWIGLGADGTSAVPNQHGVRVRDASNNAIGGSTTAHRNVISGNQEIGVLLETASGTASGNTVAGNRIGTSADGLVAVPNASHGIQLGGGVSGTTVGGSAAGAGNVIAGNGGRGVIQNGLSASGTVIAGNWIGLSANGTALGNGAAGIEVNAGGAVTIGGATPAHRNVVGGNAGNGISVGTSGSVVRNNYVGTSPDGTSARPNASSGVWINSPDCTLRDNVVGGNTGRGVLVQANNATIQGNRIGTTADGMAALGNGGAGIELTTGADSGTVIGGSQAGQGNQIAANPRGILASSGNVTILGNNLGRNADDTATLGSPLAHIRLRNNLGDAAPVTIGGVAPGEGNVIAGSSGRGVELENQLAGDTTRRVTIRGNRMYGNAAGIGLIGAPANDGVYTDTLPNRAIDSPVLTRAVLGTNTLSVVGYVGSAALQPTFAGALVDLYVSNGGQGQTWLGTVTANADGEFAGTVSTAGVTGLVAGTTAIVATATDAQGNTSAFGTAATTAALAPLQNGAFETGTNPGTSWVTLSSGNTTGLAGWVVTGHSVETVGSYWAPAEGTRSIDLSGSNRGGLAQVVQTVAGQTYTVTFAMAGNPACAPTTKGLDVSAGGASGSFAFDAGTTSLAAMGWVDRSVSFTATSEATVLWFRSRDATACGPALDNVRLTLGGAPAATLSGTVFEDVNYGGGSGRPLAGTAGASPRAAARVELYDGTGALVAAATTDASGRYAFAGRAAGSYTVRVVSGTVTSSRTGYVPTLVPVVTYRTDASGSTAVPDRNFVGGSDPTKADAGNGTSTLAALSGTNTTAQAVTPVTLAGDVTGLDFGFHFGTVVNTRDTGYGSLRQVITNVNTLGGESSLAVAGRSAGLEHVVFMLPNGTAGSGLRSAFNVFTTPGGSASVATFTPASSYPDLAAGTVLDAQTQPGWTGRPLLEVSGAALAAGTRALALSGGNVLRGLIVNRVPGVDGLLLNGSGNVVQGNWVGLDATGTAAAANGRDGIAIRGNDQLIGGTTAAQRNVVSGNARFGIDDATPGLTGIVITGNHIGTNAAGTAAVPNGSHGVVLDGVAGARVGGPLAGEGNVIAGNGAQGVNGGVGIVVQANLVGLLADGSPLGNGQDGLYLNGANAQLLGNVVGANGGQGIVLATGASGSVVRGNIVGLAPDGVTARGNQGSALQVQCATGCTVGGPGAGDRNVLAASTAGHGIDLQGTNSVVQGNFVGTDVGGTLARGATTLDGIHVTGSGHVLGGTAAGAGNVVSGNGRHGIHVRSSASSVTLVGNRVGTNAAGTAAVGNAQHGIVVAAPSITVGGTAGGSGNVVSGNVQHGIHVTGTGATIQGNVVGLGADGVTAIGNGQNGVHIDAAGATIGGMSTAARNVVAANGTPAVGYHGILVCAGGTTIQNNRIGTDANGLVARGNANDGIAGCATLTGTVQVVDNLISGNGRNGLLTWNSGNTTAGVGGTWTLLRNTIGQDASGANALPNGWRTAGGGVVLLSGGATVGDGTAANGNVIAGNTGPGVLVAGATSTGSRIQANRIWGNSGVGIDLGNTGGAANGVTANDGAKTTGQPNLLMDTPVITTAALSGGELAVWGYVGSAAGQSVFAGSRVEVFVSDEDPSGFGEGRTFLGFLTADATGAFAGRLAVPVGVTLVPGTTRVTGTATDTAGNTGEFGANVLVSTGLRGRVFEDLNYGGGAGRDWTTAQAQGAQPVPGARVEVYRTATGAFVEATTTGADGSYVLPAPTAESHTVRVVVGTVVSTRTGAVAGLWPVLTYRAQWASGATTGVTDNVGGNAPRATDPPANATAAAWATLTTSATSQPTAFSTVALTATGQSVTGLDFGFSFDTVVNTNDSGPGSLRQALLNANALGGDAALAQAGRTAGVEHIVFMLADGTARPGLSASLPSQFTGGVASIRLSSELPTLSTGLVLDAQTQPGWTDRPVVEIDASAVTGCQRVLQTAGGNRVAGFVLNRCAQDGLWLLGSPSSTAQGLWIGLNAAGTAAAPNGEDGIDLDGGAHRVGGTTAAQRNVVSGNVRFGIDDRTVAGGGHVIVGNWVGLNAAGTAAVPNGSTGIQIDVQSNVRIGGSAAGEGNVVSGNGSAGITVSGADAVIEGNVIGLNPSGTAAIGNAASGVSVGGAAVGPVRIGGSAAGAGNTLSGNGVDGVQVSGGAGVSVLGNRIGTSADGQSAVPNARHGVSIATTATGVTVGSAGAGNLISGNAGWGVAADGNGHTVAGNRIGTDAAGATAMANGNGVRVTGSNVLVGGPTAADGNLVTGRTGLNVGIRIDGGDNTVRANRIGTNAAGTARLGSPYYGVLLAGGSTLLRDNLVSGNALGVWVSGGSGSRILGNLIGTDATGTAAIGNVGEAGIFVTDVATDVTIGGTATGEPNVIANNSVGIAARAATGTAVPQRIRISGNSLRANVGLGIDLLTGFNGSHVGGVTPNDGARSGAQPNQLMDHPVFTSARARGNQLTVAGYVGSAAGQALFANARVEVFESDDDATGFGEGRTYLGFVTTDAAGNFSGTVTMPVAALRIGTRLTGTATDASGNTSEFGANFTGLVVDQVVNDTGDAVDASPGDGLCATASGVCTLRAAIQELNASGAQASTPTVAFALPGCTTAGQAACRISPATSLPVLSRPMAVDGRTQPGWTASPLVALSCGGSCWGEGLSLDAPGSGVHGLVIGGWSSGQGVRIRAGGQGAVLTGNWIGLAADGVTAAPNSTGIGSDAADVRIGGSSAAERNVVAGNTSLGLELRNGSTGAVVIGNWFGLSASGTPGPANGAHAIRSRAGTTMRIGGAAAGEGNRFGVTGTLDGLSLDGDGGQILGNTFGLAADGTTAARVARHAIYLMSGTWQVGGTAPGEANRIEGSGGNGILVNNGARARISGNAIRANALMGIDLGHLGAANSGVGDGITANDGAYNLGGLLATARANDGIDFPVITGAGLNGSQLAVYGYVGTGTGNAAFAGARIEVFRAESNAVTETQGEGAAYLGSLVADADGRFSGTLAVPPGGLAVGDVITATATDATGNTSEFGPNWTTTTLAGLAPARFDAFETATTLGSLEGRIRTMVAGRSRALRFIAVDAAGGAIATLFGGTVQVQWVDASGGGATGPDGCGTGWPVRGTAATLTFTSGVLAQLTQSVTPPDAGRHWRLRFVHTTPLGQTITACSRDGFAVRPSDLVVTAVGSQDSRTAGVGGAARSLTNADPAGGVVHRAGRPFALRAQALAGGSAVAAGYTGATARLEVTGCTLPDTNCRLGTLQVGGGTAALTALSGQLASDQATYDEVGAIRVRLVDDDFAAIDTDDTPLTSSDPSEPTRRIAGAEVTLGRFVPDSYRLEALASPTLATANTACRAGGPGYTFYGQGFRWRTAPQVRVTALNAAGGVTRNWSGALQRWAPVVAQQLMASGTGASLGQTPMSLARTDTGNGTATLAPTDSPWFSLARDGTAPPSQPTFAWQLAIDDAVEDAVAGNGRITGALALAGIGFDNGADVVTGRLSLAPAHGDARTGVRLLVELQRLSSAGWVTATDDCARVSVGATHLVPSEGTGALAGADLCRAAPPAAPVELQGGRTWIRYPGTPGGQSGRLRVTLNTAARTDLDACVAGLPAPGTQRSAGLGLPWLQPVVAGSVVDPTALLTWGRANRDLVMRREQIR